MKIAPGIHRIGDKSIVNSYLVEGSGEVTIIDAGVPGFYRDIPRELDQPWVGRSPMSARSSSPTGHTHIGFAERLRREQGIPVSVHEMDADLARGDVPNPSKGFGPTKLGPLLGFLWFTILRGGLRTPKLREVATFGDGATRDVPGSPRVILTPGHTSGSAALHVPSLGALVVGDAFATYAVTTGARGPQVAPFTADAAEAVASLPASKREGFRNVGRESYRPPVLMDEAAQYVATTKRACPGVSICTALGLVTGAVKARPRCGRSSQ